MIEKREVDNLMWKEWSMSKSDVCKEKSEGDGRGGREQEAWRILECGESEENVKLQCKRKCVKSERLVKTETEKKWRFLTFKEGTEGLIATVNVDTEARQKKPNEMETDKLKKVL